MISNIGSLVSAAKLAWTVYTACQAAPHDFKVLSEEVEALHIILESTKKVVSDVNLDESKTNDLHRVSQGCITVLTELEALIEKYKTLGTPRRITWARLRWGQENIDQLRARLTSNISLFLAFNSSLINASQTTVLTKLDEILAEGRTKEQKPGVDAMPRRHQENHDILLTVPSVLGVSRELRGYSDRDIPSERESHFIDDAVYDKHPSTSPGTDQTSDEVAWQLEIVSATFGTLDVTDHMQQFFRACRSNLQAFIPTTAFFGGVDSIPNYVKAFILVWRMTRPSGNDAEPWYSVFQTTRSFEGHPITLAYNTTLPRFIPSGIIPHNILILSASYHTWDVTAMVTRIAAAQHNCPLVVQASNPQFGADPAVNTLKQLSVTYAYRLPDGSFDVHTQVNGELGSIIIPSHLINHHTPVVEGDISAISPQPQLTIHAAYWADLDVTQLFRSRVRVDQTLHFSTISNFPFDPWYNVSKTYSIMYQYNNGPLQLIVFHDSSGMIFISPTTSPQRNIFNPAERHKDKVNILAVIWGAMEVKLDISQFRWISERGRFPCNNEWFKFDGRPGWPKTCHMFYELGTTGIIRCMAVREGGECCLPQMPL